MKQILDAAVALAVTLVWFLAVAAMLFGFLGCRRSEAPAKDLTPAEPIQINATIMIYPRYTFFPDNPDWAKFQLEPVESASPKGGHQ